MARALLDLAAPTCRGNYCGSMDSWMIIIVILLCLLGIGLTVGILYKLLAPRLALKRGRVPGFMCFPIAKLKDEERHIYLTARCPLGEGEFAPTECPICLTNVTSRHRWVGFPCQHGVCRKCLWPMVKAKEELSACPLCRAPLFRCASAKQTHEQEVEELQPEAGAAQERGQGQAEGGVPAALAPTAPSSSSGSSASSSSATSEGWSRAGSMALMDDGAGGVADLAGGVELTVGAEAVATAGDAGAAQSGRAGTPVGSLEGSTTASAAAVAGAMQA